ncbi:hypothetical protein PIROE2DRAFT_2491 [Piromyces sp. E2]|nr:hypothetical protein PIROE2DRAFT_2491 [Piromyces sp. E2]|eukprot:OUM69621.1 hypothetical protein PIROE2DRAFT_2491 [Piromyces sp. E2]
MNVLILIYFILYISISFSKSIENSQSFIQNSKNKKYIIVYKNIIEYHDEDLVQKQSQANHLRKRTLIQKNLKSKYNLLTLKYKLNHRHDELSEEKKSFLSERIQPDEMNSTKKNPTLTKSFMFVNEIDVIREVYGNTNDQNFMKRSAENHKNTLNEFIKAINSTEFPIDYIEEDFPVSCDDISDEDYREFMNHNDKKLIKRLNILNIVNETLEEGNYVFGDNIEIQKKNVEWGLDRIDQRQTNGDNTYKYPKKAGRNVNVYILDTGLNFHHKDYKSRCYHGANFVLDETDEDLYGHGSYVAGIIGG